MPLAPFPPCPPYMGKGEPGLSKTPLGGCPVCSKPLGGCGCDCCCCPCPQTTIYQVWLLSNPDVIGTTVEGTPLDNFGQQPVYTAGGDPPYPLVIGGQSVTVGMTNCAGESTYPLPQNLLFNDAVRWSAGGGYFEVVLTIGPGGNAVGPDDPFNAHVVYRLPTELWNCGGENILPLVPAACVPSITTGWGLGAPSIQPVFAQAVVLVPV